MKRARSLSSVVSTPPNCCDAAGTTCNPLATAGKFCETYASKAAGLILSCPAIAGIAFVRSSVTAAPSPVRSERAAAMLVCVMTGLNDELIRSNAGPTENRFPVNVMMMNVAPSAIITIAAMRRFMMGLLSGSPDRCRSCPSVAPIVTSRARVA